VSPKKPIQILRERRGGVPKERLAKHREQKRFLKTLREALRGGPLTVPQLAAATGFGTADVLWHLMAMKKFGEVVEGEERDGYYEYGLAEEGE
jgi:hypothetical protein